MISAPEMNHGEFLPMPFLCAVLNTPLVHMAATVACLSGQRYFFIRIAVLNRTSSLMESVAILSDGRPEQARLRAAAQVLKNSVTINVD